MKNWGLCLITFLYLATSFISCQQVVLRDNKYDGILIAISEDVPYDPQLIPRIKEVFNKSSAALFYATRYRAYFNNITILVPSNWTEATEVATSETFNNANIRVDIPSPRYGNNPWVSQTAGCGVPGDFMHLTPQFLLDVSFSERQWGPTEKVIIHEWGHLRWGLFDEYPIGDDITGHFYYSPSSNQLEASRCNINVEGRMRNRIDGSDCQVDQTTGLPESECRFYPSNPKTKASSSMMYLHYLQSVTTFCEDDDLSPDTIHNYEAPSRHNKLCSGRSTWSVIMDSNDFTNGKNTPLDDKDFNTEPHFRIIKQKSKASVVVVMDASKSMVDSGQSFNLKLVTAVRRYLLYTVPTGAKVGLVQYSDTAVNLTSELVEITDDKSRQQLADLVTPQVIGGTATGRGLESARRLLNANNTNPAGSRIVLMTDGEENISPWVKDILPKIQADGIIVDTIMLGTSASNTLISLAATTGGFSFYSSGADDSTSLSDAYAEVEKARITDPKDVPVSIISEVIKVSADSEVCEDLFIDNGLRRETTFTFSWSVLNSRGIKITLKTPDGETKNAVSDISSSDGMSAAYRCPDLCQVGKWKLCIANSKNMTVNVAASVTSKVPRTSNGATGLPILVKTKLQNPEPDFTHTGKPVIILATVTKGSSPIINAKVMATIESPSGDNQTVYLELKDDGANADVIKDDGTYSGYIINAAETGKHSISVKVINNSETQIKKISVVSSAPTIAEPGEPLYREKVEYEKSDDFQRQALAGFFQVMRVNKDPNRDLFPPSRILDLTIKESSYDRKTITLEWTAVGDDLDQGNATRYEVYYASDYKTMLRALNNATLLTESSVIQGSIDSPKPAYTKEVLTVQINNVNGSHVYAIKAVDDDGKKSELSNIVSTNLEFFEEAKKLANKHERPIDPEDTGRIVGIAVGVSVGVVLLLIIVIAAVVIVRKNKRQTKNTSQFSGNPPTYKNKGYEA